MSYILLIISKTKSQSPFYEFKEKAKKTKAKKRDEVTPGDIDLQNQDFYLKYAVWGWLGDSTSAQ